LFHGLLLLIVFVFLIIGFSAFSSPKDPAAGMLNTIISLLVDLVAIQVLVLCLSLCPVSFFFCLY